MRFVRHLVSQNKERFISDGFDLDLTYITDMIIAMGLPATGNEAMCATSFGLPRCCSHP